MPVKLLQRKIKTRISLYLESGRGPGKRVKLQQWLYIKPKTFEEKEHNRQALFIAENKRTEAERAQIYGDTAITSPDRLQTSLLDYLDAYDKVKRHPDRKFKSMLAMLKVFLKERPHSMKDVNDNLVNDFKDSLTVGLAAESAIGYFGAFKSALNRARVDGYLLYDVREYKGRIRKIKGLSKETLDPAEIQLLAKTDCRNETVKLAFLFCCFTGLDFADTFELKWSEHIRPGVMIKPREKTANKRTTPLHNTALSILARLDKATEYVFQNLPHRENKNGLNPAKNKEYSLNACNKTLKLWVERAGIAKHITWHCARHSFGTNLEGDEGTVARLLGHSDTKMVKVYRRVKDERLKAAVDSLKGLEF